MAFPQVDLLATVAAMSAFIQAAAAAIGVLAVGRTASEVLGISSVEEFGVGMLTLAVAVALTVGCARVLTGRSSREVVGAAAASLLISGYWILRRPAAVGFPEIAFAYAALPLLILVLLRISRTRTRTRTGPSPRPTPGQRA